MLKKAQESNKSAADKESDDEGWSDEDSVSAAQAAAAAEANKRKASPLVLKEAVSLEQPCLG